MAKTPKRAAAEPAPAPTPTPAVPPALYGSDAFPATFDLGGGAIAQLGDVVRAAFEAAGCTVDEWNALEQPWRDAAITTALKGVGVAWPPEPTAETIAETPAEAPAEPVADEEAAPIDLGPDVTVTMLVSMSGAVSYVKDDPYVCSAAEAGRLHAAGIAQPATDADAAAIDAYHASLPTADEA